LREKAPHLTIAHFWHIPWPDWSVFRVCPQAKEILEGLLGNDLIGFQIPLFGKNFMSCVKECLDAEVEEDPPSISYQGRKTYIKTFSIGIDYEKFNHLASLPRTRQVIKKLKEKYQFPTYLGISVDRLDYTKALIKRLQAIELFFEKYKRFKSKVSFFQVAIPTRFQEPYISYKYNVEKLIYRINEKYAQGTWKPIIYVDKKIEHQDLAAYYRLADFAIISSIYDGMNLVAKEFVASQVDEKGVLILSELTGAAEALDGAILVNPYDIEDFAENIKKTLLMSEREKKGRMLTLRTQVKGEDIYKWINDFLQEMKALSACKAKEEDYLFNHLPRIQETLSGKQVILFLDYDGTLTPIVETPDQAVLSEETRSLLRILKESVKLVIISGRGLADLKRMVDLTDILYVGNHGAEICDRNTVQVTHLPDSNQERLLAFLDLLKEALSSIPGVLVEEKGITASVHFRKVAEDDLGDFYDLFWKTAQGFQEEFRITKGKKVFEIRPLTAWNKGDAVTLIRKTSKSDSHSIYIGDDITDEDAYRVLRGKGISISIGRNPASDYYLKNQNEVNVFLEHLVNIIRLV
ncbi:MAG: trehalose-phosphatase, partial [Pseudomonadota bacterium]